MALLVPFLVQALCGFLHFNAASILVSSLVYLLREDKGKEKDHRRWPSSYMSGELYKAGGYFSSK